MIPKTPTKDFHRGTSTIISYSFGNTGAVSISILPILHLCFISLCVISGSVSRLDKTDEEHRSPGQCPVHEKEDLQRRHVRSSTKITDPILTVRLLSPLNPIGFKVNTTHLQIYDVHRLYTCNISLVNSLDLKPLVDLNELPSIFQKVQYFHSGQHNTNYLKPP